MTFPVAFSGSALEEFDVSWRFEALAALRFTPVVNVWLPRLTVVTV